MNETSAAGDQKPSRSLRYTTMRYTTLRLAILAVVLMLLWLVRVRGALLVVLALIISAMASYALLRGQRDAMAKELAAAADRRRTRGAQRAAREDDIAEQMIREERSREEAGSRDSS